jgi:RimJ/RimL family protein N-acetyltransferase
MPERFEYVLDLQRWTKPTDKTTLAGLSLRTPEISDLRALAELMLEAYRGTIDYEGETIAEAVDELQRYLAPSAKHHALLKHSALLTDGTMLVSACLVMHWSRRNCPSIGYVISHPLWKRRGLARHVVAESLCRLANDGHREVRTIITKGNAASEGLFLSLGFTRLTAEATPTVIQTCKTNPSVL